MGQRLNIEIEFHGNPVANCYFHWSAYTTSAIDLVKIILQKYEDEIKHEDMPDTVKAIKCLEACDDRDFMTGQIQYAGLSGESYKVATEKYANFTFNEATSRNAGLIAITEEEMDNTRRWEEGRVNIDLSDETIQFYVFWSDGIEDYIENEIDPDEDEDEEEGELDNILDLPFYSGDSSKIAFSEFDKFADFVCKNYKFLDLDMGGNACITTRIE